MEILLYILHVNRLDLAAGDEMTNISWEAMVVAL